MSAISLVATATFGLEAVVKREIEALGYGINRSEDGRIIYQGDERAIVKSNLWLRCADRVYIKMGEFTAVSFEELFNETASLPWESWITEDGKFTVVGTSVKSTLHSVPGCQSIIKKAIVSRLQKHYKTEWFKETGAEYTVRFMFQKDCCMLLIDTSGSGLHKRGYRVKDVAAPIKETLAAALVQLSFYKEGRLLADPMCGSGTIAIEAAMLARNIAPGLSRDFACRHWKQIPEDIWAEEKKAAYEAINYGADVRILASDIDKRAIFAASANAEEAGVDDCIKFSVRDAKELNISEISSAASKAFPAEDGDEFSAEYGVIITNPPYGERIGEKKEMDDICHALSRFSAENPTWSLFIISADERFETTFGRKADRRRKLFNGNIKTCYYQYHGQRPGKKNE